MQILGKRSKILLIAVAIVMLVAIGVSFAVWDSMSAVKAASGNSSTYANAKVGEKIQFGNYYQDGTKTGNKYNKQPITWIVVDKDERIGQLTLMSEKILAAGSFFGNYYNNLAGSWGAHYDNYSTVAGVPHNQAYVDSTVRAYLNNLERLDLGGDTFDATDGYKPSSLISTYDITKNEIYTNGTGLLASVGFSNKNQFTYLNTSAPAKDKSGFFPRADGVNELYYRRPIDNAEFQNRPATLGFFDEAFDEEEKTMIVPKQIAGYTGFRWPDSRHDIQLKSYIEGALDKVWLPSATELNVMGGQDWEGLEDKWTSPSDEIGSTVFEYFKNYNNYGFASVSEAVKATRTKFAENSFAMNYSIPVYNMGTTTVNTDINAEKNSTDQYWTRSPASPWDRHARTVHTTGSFYYTHTQYSHIGVRPCVIVKY